MIVQVWPGSNAWCVGAFSLRDSEVDPGQLRGARLGKQEAVSEPVIEDSWAGKPAEEKKNVLQPPTPDRPFYNSQGASAECFDTLLHSLAPHPHCTSHLTPTPTPLFGRLGPHEAERRGIGDDARQTSRLGLHCGSTPQLGHSRKC